MLAMILRTAILYLSVVVFMRIMGKRQVGELQPGELCVTILISELASIPIDNLDRPIISGLIPICVLVICEVTMSCLSLKMPFLRRLASGKPAIVINQGKVDRLTLKKLRMSVDDLIEGLRQNGIFELESVNYAIMETNGKLSVLPFDECSPVTKSDLNIAPQNTGVPITVISDGRLQMNAIKSRQINLNKIEAELKRQKLKKEDVFIMQINDGGEFHVVRKGGAK